MLILKHLFKKVRFLCLFVIIFPYFASASQGSAREVRAAEVPVPEVTGRIMYFTIPWGMEFDESSFLQADGFTRPQNDALSFNGTPRLYRAFFNPDNKVGQFPKVIEHGAGYSGMRWHRRGFNLGETEDYFAYGDASLANKPYRELFNRGTYGVPKYLDLELITNSDTVTVKYDTNSGGKVVAPSSISKQTRTDFTTSELPTLSRPGYSFDGWYNQAEGGKKISKYHSPYSVDSSIYNGTTLQKKEVTLYAHWIENKSEQLNVDYYDSSTLLNRVRQTVWGTFAFPTAPKKTGFIFKDWTLEPNGGTSVTGQNTPLDFEEKITGTSANQKNLKLYAQWRNAQQYKVNVHYVDRNLQALSGQSSVVDQVYESDDYTLADARKLLIPNKVFVAHKWDTGSVTEGTSPSVTNVTSDKDLYLIYGNDNSPDGIEDYQVTRAWELEDGTAVPNLASLEEHHNVGGTFDKDYQADVANPQLLNGLDYKGYKINGGALQTGTPNELINVGKGNFKVSYVFSRKKYDLKVNYVDSSGNPLSLANKTYPRVLTHGADYLLDQSILDVQSGKAPYAYYMGSPVQGNPSATKDLTVPISASTVTGNQEITVVYDNVISVTIPTELDFSVRDEVDKTVESPKYTIKNNSKSSKLQVTLDTKQDVNISTNDSSTQLIPSPLQNELSEKLYLTLNTDIPNSVSYPLLTNTYQGSGTQIVDVLNQEEEVNIFFSGQYYGEVPDFNEEPKHLIGQFSWHFSAVP